MPSGFSPNSKQLQVLSVLVKLVGATGVLKMPEAGQTMRLELRPAEHALEQAFVVTVDSQGYVCEEPVIEGVAELIL